MIKKTIFVSLILFIIYSFFLKLNPKLGSSQNQVQDNFIKAQKFVYEDTGNIKNVIVGSSLSCRLIMDSLPNFYNLSFGGQSIFDGLKIIKNKDVFPKNVFIETNIIMKGESEDFTNSFFSPLPYFLKKNFIAFRADKQPVSIFIQFFTSIKSTLKRNFLRFINLNATIKKTETDTGEMQDIQNDQLFKKMLDLEIIEHSKKPNSVELKNKLALLHKYVLLLKENNVNVYFFEMPINSSLMELRKTKIIRNEINLRFPVGMVYHVPVDGSVYLSSDGIHLGYEEALKYTLFFKNNIYRITPHLQEVNY